MSKLTYGSYGAIGDGVTDDFEAIRAAHAYANEHGLTVYADEGKTYYLGQHTDAIVIKTDTVWYNAEFIIDDRGIVPTDPTRGKCVFYIGPDAAS